MLSHEFKKIFGVKKRITLLILISVIICFFTITLSQLGDADHRASHFYEFRSFFCLYGMTILYIIIFVHISFFPMEEKYAMSQILMTSRFGTGELVKTKVILAFLFTNILAALCVASSLIGYAIAFAMDFKIPITEELDTLYINMGVNTSGNILLLMMVAFILSANFTALLSMFLSAKIKNTFLVGTLLFIVYFTVLFSFNPSVGRFFALMPFGNYVVIADTLPVLYTLGPFVVTPHSISLLATLMLISILSIKIRTLYTP